MIELGRTELTIAPTLGALGFAHRQASSIAPADDRFRPGCANRLASALATKRMFATMHVLTRGLSSARLVFDPLPDGRRETLTEHLKTRGSSFQTSMRRGG